MNIEFDSINESDYFKEVIGSETSAAKQKNKITIGKLNKRSKSEFQNIDFQVEKMDGNAGVDIYIHQLKNEGLYENKTSVLHVLGYLNSKKFDAKIKIHIIADNYNYFYKEYYSAIYCDTEFQNSFKANTLKIAIVIIIKKYFSFRFTHFLRALYHRLRRFLGR